MALNDDEKKLLAELTERANAPEEDDDFEIEVYDTAAGKGARLPYRTGKSWLHQTFGIGTPDTPPAGEDDGGEEPTAGGKGKGGAGRPPSYFGRGAKK